MTPAQRFLTKEKAALEVYGKGGNIIAELRNISSTGACLTWSQPDASLQKGDLVRMTVVLKALNRKHNISAEVIWVKDNMSGVNFIHHNEVLDRLVSRTSR